LSRLKQFLDKKKKAEGVGNEFPKAKTISVEPGAPIFGNGVRARAFSVPREGSNPHVRLVRPKDPITVRGQSKVV
jgi:hypothetical protein